MAKAALADLEVERATEDQLFDDRAQDPNGEDAEEDDEGGVRRPRRRIGNAEYCNQPFADRHPGKPQNDPYGEVARVRPDKTEVLGPREPAPASHREQHDDPEKRPQYLEQRADEL